MQTFEEFLRHVYEYNLDFSKRTNKELKHAFSYCNGCGSKGGIIFPSTMYLVNIEPACNLHDMDWEEAKDWYDLVSANHRFRLNMEKIIDIESSNKFMIYLRSKRMFKYYNAVKLIGTYSYAKERGFQIPSNYHSQIIS